MLEFPDVMPDDHNPKFDKQLDRVLRALPDRPVASNFTARVLQSVALEARPAPARRSWFTAWLPRFAPVALALVAALCTYAARTNARSAELARSVAAVTQVASLPSPEVLKDFDAVRCLNTQPAADRELLALLQ
ncbi:MAG: hypothetical protein RLZZ350_1622 [Verrucomicrobiota bacterium]